MFKKTDAKAKKISNAQDNIILLHIERLSGLATIVPSVYGSFFALLRYIHVEENIMDKRSLFVGALRKLWFLGHRPSC